MRQLLLLFLTIFFVSYFFFYNQWDSYLILSKDLYQSPKTDNFDLLIVISDSSILHYNRDLELSVIKPVNLLESLTEVQLKILTLSGEEQLNYIAAMYDISKDISAPNWATLDQEAKSKYIDHTIKEIQLIREQNKQTILSNIKSERDKRSSILLLDRISIDDFIEFFDIKEVYEFIYKANKFLAQYRLSNDFWVFTNINTIEYQNSNGLKIRYAINSSIEEQLNRFAGVLSYYNLESIKYLDISNDAIVLMLK